MIGPIAQLCQLIAEKLRDEPEASLVELVAHVEGAIAANPELTAALQSQQRMVQLNQDGTNYQTLVKDGGIANIGTHYHISQERLELALRAILENLQSPLNPKMKTINFESYLQSLCDDTEYQEWQDIYTSLRAEKVKPSPAQESRQTVESRDKPEQWDDALAGLRHYSANHVLLVGKPGSGKSTALRQLLWEEARNALAAIRQGKTDFKIPVLIELRERKEEDIIARIQKNLRRTGLDTAAIEELLLTGRFLLLFDGLNEIPSPTIWAKLTEFQSDRDFRGNPRVFTTRELSSDAELNLKEKLVLLPLAEPQMRLFVEKRLLGRAELLLNQLKDRLRELAETPLLLKILCDVVRESPDGNLPANRGDLFRREFTRRYKAFKPKRGYISEVSRHLTESLLQYLAFRMIKGKSLTEPELQISKVEATQFLQEFLQNQSETDTLAKASEYIEDLLEWDLLQIASDSNEIEFHHQLFQEYYAAEYLLQLLPNLSDEQLKRDYLNLLKWTEPIALMLALVDDEKQALRVVELALDDVDLLLGARLAGELTYSVQQKSMELIDKLKIPVLFRCRLLEKTSSDSSIATLRNLLFSKEIQVRLHAVNSLGKIGTEYAARCLIVAFEDDECQVIDNAARWLREIASPDLLTDLFVLDSTLDVYVKYHLPGIIYSILRRSKKTGHFNSLPAADPSMRLWMDKYHKNEEFMSRLIKTPEEAIERLSAYRNKNKDTPKATKSSEELVDLSYLSRQLKDQCFRDSLTSCNFYERDRYFEYLWRQLTIWQTFSGLDGELASKLVLNLKSEDDGLKDETLCFMNLVMDLIEQLPDDLYSAVPEQVIRFLNDVFFNEVKFSREEPLYSEELWKLIMERAISFLVKTTEQSEFDYVRGQAIDALANFYVESEKWLYSKSLKDESPLVRASAVEALGSIGKDEAIPLLFNMLSDRSFEVRRSAVWSLLKMFDNILHPAEMMSQICRLYVDIYDGDKSLETLLLYFQNSCGFYSHEIWQAAKQIGKNENTTEIIQDSSIILLTQIDQTTRTTYDRIEKMADEPRIENKFEITDSTINAPVGTSGVTHNHVTVPDSNKGINWGNLLAIVGILVGIVAIPISMTVSGAFNEEFKQWFKRVFPSQVEEEPKQPTD